MRRIEAQMKGSQMQKQTDQQRFSRLILSIFYLLMLSNIAFCDSKTDISALPDAFAADDLLWEIKLGTHQYTIPTIDNNQLFIGINDRNLEHSVMKSLWCMAGHYICQPKTK
jgi:hypothetical protein